MQNWQLRDSHMSRTTLTKYTNHRGSKHTLIGLNMLLSRIVEEKSSEIEINFLYETFKFECLEAGESDRVPSVVTFVDYIKCFFPGVNRARKRTPTGSITVYRGIKINPLPSSVESVEFSKISDFKPQCFFEISTTDSKTVFETLSDCQSNGNNILKELTFHADGKFEVSISQKVIDLTNIGVDCSYKFNNNSIKAVFDIVDGIRLCDGVQYNKQLIVSRFHTLDTWKCNSGTFRSLKSLNCMKAVPFHSKTNICRICQKMTFSSGKENKPIKRTSCDSEKNEVPKSSKPCIEDIKRLFPNAPDNMVTLLLEQANNVDKHPNGRRWSKTFIATCLQLFNRSPKCYEMLLESKMLVLSSKSVLIMYKNAIKQEPGFDNSMFEWMHEEAIRRRMGEDERLGAIIFDEMSIQEDIQIEKNGAVLELSGFTDLGHDGDLFNQLRRGKAGKYIGTHVLQLLFLGLNGFRFPFAHFVTDNIQASELYGLFWTAIYKLYEFGFQVLYTCMDGAQANRSFMHVCLGDKPTSYLAQNPCTSQPVAFIMDYSHVVKKIRNNILKSGLNPRCTRLLTLPNNYEIHWQMFIDFYMWDQQNGLQLNRKLTNEHIYLDSQSKMRNHLAEQVLNIEMCHAVRMYQQSLGDKGIVLNGLIELLEQTSLLIKIFRDMRPIKDKSDERLAQLKNIDSWFFNWEKSIAENPSIPKKDKAKCLLSSQCHEDIHACISGFLQLCDSFFKINTTLHITPGLVNSDVIENVFNQQRSTYNGANTNPNALQYKQTINSIVIGQSSISRKSNAGESALQPFTASLVAKPKKRKTPVNEGTKIKVLRV